LLIGQDQALTAAELIARHVKSLGKPADVAQIKSRGISGKAAVQFIQGAKGGISNGQFICVSEGNKVGLKITFPNTDYPQEYFAYNGSEVTVGHISPGQRSPLADFIFRYNGLMKEGYLGGVLVTSWPLLRANDKQPEYKYTKEKIAKVEHHVLEHNSKNAQGTVKIKLYFDPKTYHHVQTQYSIRLSNDVTARNSVQSGGPPRNLSSIMSTGRLPEIGMTNTIQKYQPDSIYVMTEKFSNFATIGGLELPQDYSIEYSAEGTGDSYLAKWELLAEHWMPNRGDIDQSFFVAQK
jgi:hypothetical protein